MTFLSLFSGAGGLDLGLERAGWRCVGQVEANPYRRRVLARHWPGVHRGDDVATEDYGRFTGADAVVGGFPCVDLSRMGRRAGLSAPRSGLWREMVRAVRVVRPGRVVVENVEPLLERGMGAVLGDLAALRYDAEWDCLPTNAFGLRQSRSRLFVLAHPDRREHAQPHERAVLPGQVPPAPVEGAQPVPGGVRGDHGVSDRLDIGERISACADAVSVPVAEYVGRLILATTREDGPRA